MKRATMELGGHSPVVVFGDADPEKSADIDRRRSSTATPVRSASRRRASTCRKTSTTRFLKRFTDNAKGDQARRRHRARTPRWARSPIRAASTRWTRSSPTRKARGGKIQTGGKPHRQPGLSSSSRPCITDVPDDSQDHAPRSRSARSPPIVTFKTFDEVVERANSLRVRPRGLHLHVDPKTATAIGDALESGMVGVNSVAISTPETPFGGIKDQATATRAASRARGAT